MVYKNKVYFFQKVKAALYSDVLTSAKTVDQVKGTGFVDQVDEELVSV